MAKLYGEIAAKSLLTLDKSFARANGQPLDASEVYYSLDAAKTYAAGAQAYIGQKIVVIENGVVSHYSVEDTDGNLKELGAKPVADGTTVEIAADGKITLANISDKAQGTYNAVLVNGELTWVKPSSTTVEGLSDLITALTGRVDDAEKDIDDLQAAVGAAAKPESAEGAGDGVAATGLYKLIEDALAEAKQYADDHDDDTQYDDSDLKSRIAELEKFFATADGESLDAALDTLIEIQKEIAKDDASAASMLASIQANTQAIETLNSADTVTGSVDKKIKDAIEAIPDVDLSEYAKSADVANTYITKTDASTTYATQTTVNDLSTTVTNQGNTLSTLNTKVDEIIAVGGQPNTIEHVAVNGVRLTPDEDKQVNVVVPTKFTDITDNSGFSDLISAAKAQADKGVNDAATAQATANQAQADVDAVEVTVGEHSTVIAGHTTSISDHSTRITQLEEADTAHTAEYNALKAIVDGHTTSIAGKAEQTALDTANANITKNTNAIATLNDTTIPAINAEVAKKANSADVYAKSDVYNKTEIGTIETGKTLVQMIEEAQSAATYDDTQIKADIKANTDALAILNGDVGTAGSVKAEAKAAADIAVATVVNGAPEALDTLREVAEWIANDESGAAAMANSIAANEKAIADINNETTGILATAKSYADVLFAGIPTATADALGLVRADNVSIVNNAGVLSVGAVSTDRLTQGTGEFILNGGSAI